MQIRFRTGFRGLFQAAAVGCLLVLAFSGAFAANTSAGFGSKPTATASDPGVEKTISQPIMYPRSTYQWPYSAGPSYGEVDSSQWANAGVLHTQVGSFDLTRGLPAFPAELRTTNRLGKVPVQYFVLQLPQESYSNGSFDGIRQAITAAGGAVVENLSVASHIVRLNAAAYEAVRGQAGVLTLEPYHPAFKVNPLIGRAPLFDPVKALSDVYDLDVLIFHGENPGPVAEAIKAIGGNVTGISTDALRVELNRAKLAQLAGLEPVRQIFEHLPIVLHGQESSATVQVGTSQTQLPYNLAGGTGNGIDGGKVHCYNGAAPGACGAGEPLAGHTQILMSLDSGIQLDDGDLSDTRSNAGAAGSAHRKVLSYLSTSGFGGGGDLLGCDGSTSGGFTHGHSSSAVAMGNATKNLSVAGGYGNPWLLTDTNGNRWDFDGIAYKAKLVAYDAQATPATGGCEDPGQSGLNVGDISTSLPDGYSKGARVSNFSWGATNAQSYGLNSQRIDTFLLNNKDAMVFVSAGNDGKDTNSDGIPDENSVSDPAWTKNGIVVGASLSNPGQRSRAGFSSIGVATPTVRVKPLLMAPGADGGGTNPSLLSDYNCRGNAGTGTADNDQINPVDCAIVQGDIVQGTSFSSPAAAGAALLIRDYFVRGYYPDGDLTNNVGGEPVYNVSGALVKAMLIGSTAFMDTGATPAPGRSLYLKYRFNREQGYGRIQMDKVLPLSSWLPAPQGLIIADGGIPAGKNSTTLSGTASSGATESYTLNVCDSDQELRVAIAWVEDTNDVLQRNINLELQAPSGKIYYGNYFTDDNNRDGTVTALEDCNYATANSWPQTCAERNLTVPCDDANPWSLPTCGNSARDTANPTEAIMLSPDPRNNGILDDPTSTGIDESADNQLEIGNWTVRVIGGAPWTGGSQPYAVSIAGPVCIGSSVSISRVDSNGQLGTGTFVCNNKARIRVSEVDEAGTDPAAGLTAIEISARTIVQVVDKGADGSFDTLDDVIVDQETGLVFTPEGATLNFSAADITLSDGTVPQSGNGALDVRDGQRIRAIYKDKTSGSFDPAKERKTATSVDCKTQITFGGIVWGAFGKDSFTLVSGGCEKDARNLFTFGFPDRFMDAGELVGYRFAFQSAEDIALTDVAVTLKAVDVDGDSPRDCKPQTTDCTDPNRLNNLTTGNVTILDPTKIIGNIAARAAVSVNFAVQVASAITGTPEIEMVLAISAKKAGKSGVSYAVSRHRLDVDEVSFLYSTDFPTGGSESRDWNNNETIESPTTDPKSFLDDYVFESRTFSDLTINGRNSTANLKSPWNFDTNNGGFRSGVTNTSLGSLNLTQWGEDKNLNGVLDTGEDRNGNSILDQNWGTAGGCGWQTTASAGTPGGVWHTGRIDVTTITTCLAATGARCRQYATVSGFFGNNIWWEVLTTPQFFKVHVCPTGTETDCGGVADRDMDKPGYEDPRYQVEFVNWAWNQSVDLGDSLTGVTWEMDTDPIQTASRVDFVNDNFILNSLFGATGPVTGGNAPLTDGFQMFANKSKCIDTNGDTVADHCGNASGVVCTTDTQCTGNNFNGLVGTANRQGADNCFFEGKDGTGVVKAKLPYGLAKPSDDDVRNGYCPRSDSLNGIDKSKSCITNTDCTNFGAPYTTPCTFDPGTTADQFVTANGPIRNMDLEKVNGPDMRFSTLEDIYGDSGTNFQGAVGFYTQEGTPSSQPVPSFGAAIDDMVIEWREFKLDKDTTNCGGGTDTQCADVELSTTNFYEGNSLVTITVTDKYPYDPVNNKNDCNNNGSYADGVDDQDCNNNLIRDVLVKVISDQEPAGEIVALDEISGGSNTFRGNLPISAAFDAAGVLFIARAGTDAPVVRVQYTDRAANAAGDICKNNSDLALQGLVEASTSIFVNAGRIALKGFSQTDNGDNDGWADTNETVSLTLTFTNKSGVDVDDLVATLNYADAATKTRIDCISSPTARIGVLANKASASTQTPFVFHVSPTANRVGVNDDFKARFNVTLRSNKFDLLTRTMAFAVELDLSSASAQTTAGYREDFEGKDISATTFTSMSLDLGKASSTLSNGYRCQYNDPLGPNPNQANRVGCFLGFTSNPSNAFDWHVHSGVAADNSITRAYTGAKSLHWGVHPSTGAKRDTERFSQLDALRTTNPVNLPYGATASPELSFKHQVSLMDSRGTNTPAGETADRGAVSAQLADSGGVAVGNWNKIFAYENEYDVQGTDNFSNCTFDPIDDGNDEDSYFAPSDPLRRYGPSTTCKPEFVFSWGGDTDYRNAPGKLDQIGRAFDGPGLKGAVDRGTWVWPKFSLNEFKGRRIRFRFLATSIEVGTAATYNDTNIGSDNNTADDGWYIDDVRVDAAISVPATLTVDANANSGLPGCTACTSVVAGLTTEPQFSSTAPGQPLKLTATATIDRCNNGIAQYQFWVDSNGNGVVGDAGDTLLRDWTDNNKFTDAPIVDTRYAVTVRCSSDPACSNLPLASTPSSIAPITVTCPGAGSPVIGFAGPIAWTSKTQIGWITSQQIDVVRGDLILLHNNGGNFTPTVIACSNNEFIGTTLPAADTPAIGGGYYWLFRTTVPLCNQTISYSSGAPKEVAGRDAEINASGSSCP